MGSVCSPGQVVAKYEIVAYLGGGGMGEVYLARDTWIDREVAIKVLPLKRTTDPLFRERMQREAAAGARIDHPNVVRVLDGGVTGDDVVYVVMEYLGEHVTLRTIIHRIGGPMPLRGWLQIAIAIADALTACHAVPITHRDLKPENVVHLAGGKVKVIDFGLAKIRSASIRTTMKNKKGKNRVLLTPLYAAPEQMDGPREKVTEKADIWAFGAIMVEMATGKQIWQAVTDQWPTPQQATWAMQTREPRRLRDALTMMPPPLVTLVDSCLERDPDKRPSAKDVFRGLKAVFSALPDETTTEEIVSTGDRAGSSERDAADADPDDAADSELEGYAHDTTPMGEDAPVDAIEPLPAHAHRAWAPRNGDASKPTPKTRMHLPPVRVGALAARGDDGAASTTGPIEARRASEPDRSRASLGPIAGGVLAALALVGAATAWIVVRHGSSRVPPSVVDSSSSPATSGVAPASALTNDASAAIAPRIGAQSADPTRPDSTSAAASAMETATPTPTALPARAQTSAPAFTAASNRASWPATAEPAAVPAPAASSAPAAPSSNGWHPVWSGR